MIVYRLVGLRNCPILLAFLLIELGFLLEVWLGLGNDGITRLAIESVEPRLN